MKEYKEFQFFWVIAVVSAGVTLVVSLLFVFQYGSRPLSMGSFVVVVGSMAFILVLSYGMYTRITETTVLVHFGVGLFRRSIDMNRILEATIVKSPWYYGWGVRLIPCGWLFNVSGEYSVELQLKNSNRVLRIGTQEPKQLLEAILGGMGAEGVRGNGKQ